MPEIFRRRPLRIAVVVIVAAAMWYAASARFTGGLLDLAVFMPPSATLGLMAIWSAHAFTPSRFTWRRGLIGALIGGVLVSPVVALLVAFSAAWDRASFPIVFNLGAWLAITCGLVVGVVWWTVGRARSWWRSRIDLRHPRASSPG